MTRRGRPWLAGSGSRGRKLLFLGVSLAGSATLLSAAALIGLHLYLSLRSPSPEEAALADEGRVYGQLLAPPTSPRLRELHWSALTPGATARSGGVEVAINALGFRDVEHPARKDADAYRLLVVGDSYVYGQGVRRVADLYPRRIGLSRVDGKRLEILLLGYCGADLIVYDAMFHELALPLEPDAVLISLTSNDLEDRTRPPVACLPSPLARLVGWSDPLRAELERACNQLTRHYERQLRRQFDPASEYYRKGQAALSEMQATARQRGIELFAFFFHLGTERYMDDAFRRMTSSLEIPYASLVPDVARQLESPQTAPADFRVSRVDGHPNERAHALAAERVTELLAGHYGSRAAR